MSGDFRQLLPVMENANPAKIINHTLKCSSLLWDDQVVTLRLRENMRVKNEINKLPNKKEHHKQLQDYEQWLLKLGEGRLPSAKTEEGACPDTDVIEIPPQMCWKSKDDAVEEVLMIFGLILKIQITLDQDFPFLRQIKLSINRTMKW